MILGKKKNLHDHILEKLLQKDSDVPSINNYLESKKVFVTIQGVYKALRELLAEDVIVKNRHVFSVNNIWKNKLSNLMSNKKPFFLEEGEVLQYKFNNIRHLDSFWKHTLIDIQEEIGSEATFAWLPHQFWWYIEGREISEVEYEEQFLKNKIKYFSTIGGTSVLDKTYKVNNQNAFHQIHLENSISLNRRDHISIIGDYVITTRISSNLSKSIDSLYKNILEESLLKSELNLLLKKSAKTILIVEKNKSKANKIKSKFKKYFVM